MPSTANPFGIKPVYHPSGDIRTVARTIVTGYASNILTDQPVKIGTDGSVQAAAVGEKFVGAFMGVEYTDSNGVRQKRPAWIAGTAGTDIVAYITEDPAIVYEIQSDDTVTLADVGEQMDFSTITAGSTTTGLSAIALDVSTTTTNASLRILGLVPKADNAWGDSYVNVFVNIAEHQFVADEAAI